MPQILYQHQMFKAAAPIFEQALVKLGDDNAQQTMRRVTTDQAGMSYGMSGDIPKARAIFEAASAKDPDYPMYYYNLACADAEEKNLADARFHLQQAFARKSNMLPGEKFPDPTKDDSFAPTGTIRISGPFWRACTNETLTVWFKRRRMQWSHANGPMLRFVSPVRALIARAFAKLTGCGARG